MKPELIEPIYKLNKDFLDLLKDARDMLKEDPQKAAEMLDTSIKAISEMNDKLSAMSQVQRIITTIDTE